MVRSLSGRLLLSCSKIMTIWINFWYPTAKWSLKWCSITQTKDLGLSCSLIKARLLRTLSASLSLWKKKGTKSKWCFTLQLNILKKIFWSWWSCKINTNSCCGPVYLRKSVSFVRCCPLSIFCLSTLTDLIAFFIQF